MRMARVTGSDCAVKYNLTNTLSLPGDDVLRWLVFFLSSSFSDCFPYFFSPTVFFPVWFVW